MKKIKNYSSLLITFICALVIFGIVFYIKELKLNSLLTIDFYHQYGPMLAELFDRVVNGKNLLYSFSFGLGLPIFRNFFNYLSSPFNMLMFLFNRNNLVLSMTIIIGFKAIASCCTMNYYLNNKLGRNYLFIPLSLLYGFCSYYIAYYWNIMWLDGMVWLPLITYGIEKLIDEKKILLYVISLSIALLSNYFIGYMLCIFSVLYFIMYLILNSNKYDIKKNINRCLYFGLSSLIAGGICAFALIPMYLALSETSAVSDAIPTSLYYSFTFKEFLLNHLSGVTSTVLSSGASVAPNISVGVISFALLYAFILNPKIDFKTKLCYLGLLVVIGISFFVPILDFIWHGMHVPNDLPYRFSFIYSFILIIISAYAINSIKDLDKIDGSLIFIGMLLIITFAKKYNVGNISNDAIITNYIIVCIAYILYMLTKFKKIKYMSIAILTGLCMYDVITCIDNNWNADLLINDFYSNYDEIHELATSIKDDSFYRIERDYLERFNDPSWYGYRGIVGFSSMEYENLALLLYYNGMPSNEINSFAHRYNTPIFNMMFDLKYIIGNNDLSYYDLVKEENNYNLYKFKYEPSLMYGVKGDIKSYLSDIDSPFVNQNEFIRLSTGIDGVLKEINVYDQEIVYDEDGHVIVKYLAKGNNNNYYLYCDHSDVDFLVVGNTLYYNNSDHDYGVDYIDMDIDEYVDYNEKHIITNANDNGLIEFYVGYNYYDGDVYDIYEVDQNKWNEAYNYLNENRIYINNDDESKFTFKTNFDENKTVYTSIPYDRGWAVYVDGIKTDTFKIGNALLGFDVNAGEHNIKLIYNIPYINYGITISCVSTIGLIIFTIYNKKHID